MVYHFFLPETLWDYVSCPKLVHTGSSSRRLSELPFHLGCEVEKLTLEASK